MGGGGVWVYVQVGGRWAGIQLVPGQSGVARGGDDPEPGQLWLAAALDGDGALTDTTLPPAAGRGTQAEEYEGHDGEDDPEQTEGDDPAERIPREDGPEGGLIVTQTQHSLRNKLTGSLEKKVLVREVGGLYEDHVEMSADSGLTLAGVVAVLALVGAEHQAAVDPLLQVLLLTEDAGGAALGPIPLISLSQL